MLEPIDQSNEQPAGVGIREQLKAQSARQNIERNHQRNLRIVQNQALLTSQNTATPTVEPQNAQDNLDDEPESKATETETTTTKPTLKDKLINSGKHYIIGVILGLISFGLLTIPYAIYRLVWGKKK